MKTFPSYDYTLCDNEGCKLKETCKRWLTYRKAQEEDYPCRLSVHVVVGAVTECNMYVEAKEEEG